MLEGELKPFFPINDTIIPKEKLKNSVYHDGLNIFIQPINYNILCFFLSTLYIRTNLIIPFGIMLQYFYPQNFNYKKFL